MTLVNSWQQTLAEVTTTLNATERTTAAGGLPAGGVIRSVMPVFVDGSAAAVPRGRIYATILLVDMTDANKVLATLWSDYIATPSVTPSLPNLPVPQGAGVRVEATQSGQGVVRRIAARVVMDDGAPGGGGFIHHVAPATGPTERVRVALANPVAGSTFATSTVGASEAWRVVGYGSALVTSAVPGPRWFAMNYAIGGSEVVEVGPPIVQPASTTYRFRGVFNTSQKNDAPSAGSEVPEVFVTLPDVTLPAAATVSFWGMVDPGDDLSDGWLWIEIWAVPA